MLASLGEGKWLHVDPHPSVYPRQTLMVMVPFSTEPGCDFPVLPTQCSGSIHPSVRADIHSSSSPFLSPRVLVSFPIFLLAGTAQNFSGSLWGCCLSWSFCCSSRRPQELGQLEFGQKVDILLWGWSTWLSFNSRKSSWKSNSANFLHCINEAKRRWSGLIFNSVRLTWAHKCHLHS